jgi:hypothetical protein
MMVLEEKYKGIDVKKMKVKIFGKKLDTANENAIMCAFSAMAR